MSESNFRTLESAAPARAWWSVWSDQRCVAAIHLVLLAVALTPIFLVSVPALVDYPNHLARMRILADLDGSPELQAIYAANWAVLPNLAMDAVVPWLAKLTGVIVAGQLFLATTLALNVAGTVALHRVLHGRVGLWSVAVYLVLFNYVFAFGFLNYLFGIGLFLLLFALWIALEDGPPLLRLVLAAVGALALYFCHLAAFATYGLCVAAYELSRWWVVRPRRPGDLVWRWMLAGSQFLPAAALLISANPMPGAPMEIAYQLSAKLVAPLVPAMFYGQFLDLVIFLFLVLLVGLAIVRRGIHLAPAVVMPAVGLALAVLLVPAWAFGNWGNDFRLMVPLAFLLIAGCRIRLEPRTAAIAVLAGIGIFAARLSELTADWSRYDRLYEELRAVSAGIEPGARILPAVTDWSDVGEVAPTGYRRAFYNAPAVLALDGAVFVPTLFTARGRQPLSVVPAYAAIDTPHLRPMPLDTLIRAVDPEAREEIYRTRRIGEFHYRLAGWPRAFDYVLILDFGASRNPLPEILVPIRRGSYFTMYAIANEDFDALR